MPSAKKRIDFHVTDEQFAVLEKLVQQSSQPSISALIRKLLQEYAASQNLEWPQDDSTWGGYRRSQNRKKE